MKNIGKKNKEYVHLNNSMMFSLFNALNRENCICGSIILIIIIGSGNIENAKSTKLKKNKAVTATSMSDVNIGFIKKGNLYIYIQIV